MPNKFLQGYQEKQIYRNERFTKGVVSSNDPLFEGSFRRLINFKISNQNASIENRDPFLTVPLYNLKNEKIKLSKNAFVFSLNDDTEHAYILDFNQKPMIENPYQAIFLEKNKTLGNDDFVIDGDTFEINKKRYRLAFVDTPELDDQTYQPFAEQYNTMGQEAKAFTKNFLQSGNFDIFQFPFQSEKIDQFGRFIVFVKKTNANEILNASLLKEGLASFYNSNTFNKKEVEFNIPEKVFFGETEYNFFNEFNSKYNDLSGEPDKRAYGKQYTDTKITLKSYIDSPDNVIYTKPLIYKIKKETDLKKNEDGTILKRIIKTIEINETNVKKDLEIFNDENLRYELISNDSSIINGKYKDQYLNFFVSIYNQFNIELYRGLVEITHNVSNYDEGVIETFYLKSYKNPEAHIELQDVTNYKPNINDGRSIIPETLLDYKANVKGYNGPSVDAVLLSVDLNENLESIKSPQDTIHTKFFNTNRPIFEDLKKYSLTPFFKAPKIFNTDKNKYMFRWDFVNLNEIDLNNEEELKNARPFFRTAWTELVNQPNENHNISNNETRKKKIASNIKTLRTADKYFFIKQAVIKNVSETEIINNASDFTFSNAKDTYTSPKTLEELQEDFDNWFNDPNKDTLDKIAKALIPKGVSIGEIYSEGSEGTLIVIGDRYYQIIEVSETDQLILALNKNSSDTALIIDEPYKLKGKPLNKKEILKMFFNVESELSGNLKLTYNDETEDKKYAFIFCPLEKIIINGDEEKRLLSMAYNTKGFVIDFTKDRKDVLPYNLNFQTIFNKTKDGTLDIDFDDFFKEGIQATFYLHTYKDVESLTEPDEFYDNIAYKKTSATYLFRRGSGLKYTKEDFIDDKLDKESYAIRYCKYITSYQDRIIVYGNQQYKNTVFISEEGSPYYFSLVNAFEFDHEVVHVQIFKTIIMVFTINDIWVIYPWEETSVFEGITTITKTFRYKKILYNISTEVKNKESIKNITRYVTLLSNNVLYLIKPSTFISDETEFSLNILSQNIDAIVKDPLKFINERLKYHGIRHNATDYKMNLNATDNYIKLYYSSKINDIENELDNFKWYTLILTYDILNNRWTEEDTVSFGYPHKIYLLDSSTKYEMLTEMNDELFITYQTDKYKNMMLDQYGQSYYDKNMTQEFPIEYFIDTGYLKLNEHLKKRFRTLQFALKNIDSKQITFTYNFTIDDKQFENNFIPSYTVNNDGEIMELLEINKSIISDQETYEKLKKEISNRLNQKNQNADQKIVNYGLLKQQNAIKELLEKINMKKTLISDIGFLDNFLLDFSNLETGDIMTVNQNLLGIGRLPRIQMGFSSKNRFYILSYGIIYSEQRGTGI